MLFEDEECGDTVVDVNDVRCEFPEINVDRDGDADADLAVKMVDNLRGLRPLQSSSVDGDFGDCSRNESVTKSFDEATLDIRFIMREEFRDPPSTKDLLNPKGTLVEQTT